MAPEFDIIIPVYNALSQTRECIRSVLQSQESNFRLIIVNDASSAVTSSYLRSIAATDSRIVLLENKKNLGFLDTANRGLAYKLQDDDAAAFKILLNSDTIVPKEWLSSFRKCFDSDSNIGVACPLSSNAENLTIDIPEGHTVSSFSEVIASLPEPRYPDITTAIGFCMAIKSEVLRKIGLFDRIFAPGYGEDSDMHYKIVCQGYRSVLVDNCFVYHEADASFSSSKMELVRRNRPIFDRRWQTIYLNELTYHNTSKPLERVEQHIKRAPKPLLHDVLFIIPTAKLYGGIIVVYEVVNRLNRLGISANVLVLSEPIKVEMPITFSPYFYPPARWSKDSIPEAKTYVATHFETVPYCFRAHAHFPLSKLCYLIQGYEGWFPGAQLADVVETYKSIPNRLVVSSWLNSMLQRWDCQASLISNGVDSSFFFPRDNYISDTAHDVSPSRLRLLVMARHDPQGSWTFLIGLLKRVQALQGIEVVCVGSACDDPEIQSLVDVPLGSIDRREMAKTMRSCDIFVDCSMVQGFGLMGLEAMASGVACVLTETGGVQEYADSTNAILCPIGDETALFEGIQLLSNNPALLKELKQTGRKKAEELDWDAIAKNYAAFFKELDTSHTPVGEQQLQHLNNYLSNRWLAQQETLSLIQRAEQLLGEELIDTYPPRTAVEVLGQNPELRLVSTLKNSPEGQSLLRMYDAASAAVCAAGSRADDLRKELLDNNMGGLPLLEKIILTARQFN